MRKRTGITLVLLFILTAASKPLLTSASYSPVINESLTLTVYLDGYVLVTHEIEVNNTYPAVNLTLISREHQNPLFLDEHNLPLNYLVTNGKAAIYTLGASEIKATYLTQELTTKTSKYWTLTTQVSTNATVILPENVAIISLNTIPEQIETNETRIHLLMPSGPIEITYITDHYLTEQTSSTGNQPWLLIVSLSLISIPFFASAFWILKRRKTAQIKTKKPETHQTVDLDKLLQREKDLRQEELQVIHFLAEKNGAALEAEIYENLALPRTTTWRLIKRLEKMEIVYIRKSRRQNTVAIRKKYLKTNKKP